MGKSPFKWRCSIAILVYQRISSKYADWILKDLDFLQTFKSILTKRGCARPVYSRSFEGVISRKYGEISWNIPIISPSKCLWQNLSEHATSHSFGPPACIVGTTQRLRRPPVMETLDGNTVKTMSPWAVLKKTQHLEDVQVLTGQKNRKLENLQSTGVYQGVGKGAKMSAHSSSLRKNTENNDKSM